MTKRMLIDASHPEETRVVVLDGNRIEEFDIESANRKPLKGNIYLAKVVRVEPSLQAAFVEFGGNRHGFLAFGEIHPDYYQIPVADRQRLLAMQAEEAREEDEREEAEHAARENDRGLNEALRAAEPPEEDAPQAEAAAPPVAEDPPAGDASPGQDTAGEDSPRGSAAMPPRGSAAMPMTIPVERRTGDAEELEAEAAEATVPHEGMPVAEHAPLTDMREPREEDEEGGPAEDAPPPETVGGDREEEGRERRIPPKFLRHYKIQEVIKRRQIMLVQVVKEERGTKGAALTTYISLAGRFSVLMPNSPRGGGVSRKITSAADRKRLREIIDEAGLPQGMSLIVRTAGAARPKPEIKRDCEYLLRLWDNIRERTFASTAPALIYEEADLIKRSVRDVYNSTIDEVHVEGEEAYQQAREFMRMLMPQHVNRVKPWRDGGMPLFARHGVDQHLDAMHSPVVQLKSGGYIVINQTEALVAIDVNSGRATRDRHIEDTALRTNLEAAEEVARQLRLRDLAGLIVIDFIDMESSKHDGMVERRLKEALKQDRARIQVGRISHFGLLEMSRQRLRPSMVEHAFIACPHCAGRGIVRSTESSALQVLRAIEEEASRRRAGEIVVACAEPVALWLLNRKRERLAQLEARNAMAVLLQPEAALTAAAFRIERTRPPVAAALPEGERPAALRMDYAPEPEEPEAEEVAEPEAEAPREARPPRPETDAEAEAGRRRRRRRRRGRREGGDAMAGTEDAGAEDAGADSEEEDAPEGEEAAAAPVEAAAEPGAAPAAEAEADAEDVARPRRRGRRGGRRRREDGAEGAAEGEAPEDAPMAAPVAAPAPRRTGPTPADPFAGHMDDIYSAMEAAEAAAEAAAAARRTAQAESGSSARAPAAARTTAPAADAPVVNAPADPVPDTVPPVTDTAPVEEARRAEAPAADAPVAEAAAAPATAAAPAAREEPVVGTVVKPVVLGEEAVPDLPRKRGWWKR